MTKVEYPEICNLKEYCDLLEKHFTENKGKKINKDDIARVSLIGSRLAGLINVHKRYCYSHNRES